MENNNQTVPETNQEAIPKKKNKIFPIILGVVVLLVGYFIINKVLFSMHNEDTENAQVECNISPISPRISGFVTSLRVKENQMVKKGDTLLQIDQRDLVIKVQQAEIALENAKASLEVISANVGTASASNNASIDNIGTYRANLESAKIRIRKANDDFKRYENLLKSNSVTQQQFDNVKIEKESAENQLVIYQKQLESVIAQSGVSSSQLGSTQKQIKLAKLNIDQKQTELDYSKLQLNYATITAPCDGYVSKKNVQLGQLVNVGQSLFAIVDENNIWINANFKETQIEKMKVGQAVKLDVDAYPNKDFEGKIESISAATGSKFSLIPPDNATGNFVKVVQRIPVRVVLSDSKNNEFLRAGMNVKVIVKTN